ncbi:MAG: MauE/DoxX family redox-associated membrane protein [Gemmatimonadales bacterium]
MKRKTWAVFFARGVLGLMFLMLGFHKMFVMGPLEHARQFFVGQYSDSFLPVWSLWITGTAVPFVEIIAGTLVFVGFKTGVGLIALGFDLLLVTFGHLLANPFYELHTQVIPRLVLLVFLLLVPRDWDVFSVDGWLRLRSR